MINDSNLLRISVFAIACFYASVLLFSVNISQQDGFDSILAYLINSESNFVNGLFNIRVSHRVVLAGLLERFTLVFNGSVDFRLISYFGSLSLLGVVYILFKSTQGIRNRYLVICVTYLCLFSLFHWSNIAWTTSSAQNYIIVFAVALCFFLFNKQSNLARLGAIVTGLLAPYIRSSGLLLLPIQLLWTLMRRSELGQNHALYLLLLAATTHASFTAFFFAFDAQIANSTVISTFSSNSLTSVIQLISSYLVACAGCLHFAPLALSAGIVVNLYFLILVWLQYHQKTEWFLTPTYFYCSIFSSTPCCEIISLKEVSRCNSCSLHAIRCIHS